MPRPKKLTSLNGAPALDDTTRARIRDKARQLGHPAGFARADLPDLEQDLALHVGARLPRYDPCKGPPDRFVRMLLAHAASHALRTRRRLNRRAPGSLNALLGSTDEPADPAADHGDTIGLALDVAAVLAALPRPLRRVAEALKTRSVVDAARHLKISRAALYRRLAALRAAFAATGLDQIGAPRADTPRAAGVVPW